ncbi:MAG: hypothetical protein BGO25_05665 [Acidobacteriales bacterium 59-55]|nr:hypothetical protein [Terriglobales bacterium]OJV44570.1 MAG: hypothetical protein BGO25_05665 [Acidobacteriales bacterium 59-55]
MYKVHRENEKVQVIDWRDQVVYSAAKDSRIVYESAKGQSEVFTVGDMNDEDLLAALSKAVKLDL